MNRFFWKLGLLGVCYPFHAVLAAPSGGAVQSGAAYIGQSGALTTIIQTSQNLVLSWKSFNIAASETVRFVQPSVNAVAVNRILDSNPSQILGHLQANGQVFLINPNGMVFGQGAQVNVGGLVASTLDLSTPNLSAAQRTFSGEGRGLVLNQGTLTSNNGYIALLGNQVQNQGTIQAAQGAVVLAAGGSVTLSFADHALLQVQVPQGVLNALAENGGLIQAEGGWVWLAAGAKDTVLASVVNNTGIIEAQTVDQQAGHIVLLGGMQAGTVNASGVLDASAPQEGNGGTIETSAAQVTVAPDARIITTAQAGATGVWLLDPHNLTVAASGGDLSNTTLSNNLNNTNVTLQSSGGSVTSMGNININDAVNWSANTTLTLTASNSVNINANISATGNSAGLVLNPNTSNGGEVASGSGVFTLMPGASITLSGSAPFLSIAGHAYTVLNTISDLQAISDMAGYYALGSNIDASATSAWNGGVGFLPLAAVTPFSGILEGLGHSISNLTIHANTAGSVGLVATLDGGTLNDLALQGGSIEMAASGNGSNTNLLGGLVGEMVSGSINQSSVSADVSLSGTMGLKNYVGGGGWATRCWRD